MNQESLNAATYLPERWFRLAELADSQGTVELSAAASCDGILVLARWCRELDGTWSVSALDSESEKWGAVTVFGEEECVPLSPPECVDVALERELVAARLLLATLQRDKVRLDYLDYLNRSLNACSGTLYGWKLTLSPNVRRLASDFPRGIDINDANAVGCYPTGLLSVRAVLDASILETGLGADDEAVSAVDELLARDLREAVQQWRWSGDVMTCMGCERSVNYTRRREPLNHAEGCSTCMAYPWEMFKAIGSNA